MVFVVLSAYYKHGEVVMEVFSDHSKLRTYLMDCIDQYKPGFDFENHEDSEYDMGDEIEGVYALIKLAVELGQMHVELQRGWGILKIMEIHEK